MKIQFQIPKSCTHLFLNLWTEYTLVDEFLSSAFNILSLAHFNSNRIVYSLVGNYNCVDGKITLTLTVQQQLTNKKWRSPMFSHQDIYLKHIKFEMSTPVKQNKGQLYNTVTMYFKHLYCPSTHYLLLNLSLTAIDIQKQNEISTWCEQIFFHYTWSSKQKEINVLTELIPLHVSVGMQHQHLVTDEQALVTGANLKINAYPSKYTSP